jgi:membrane protein YdbS with pleckstrin-like domain
MEEFSGFLKAVLSHWVWLILAAVALVLSIKVDFQDYKSRVAFIVVAIASVIIALYLAVEEKYRGLNEYLRQR